MTERDLSLIIQLSWVEAQTVARWWKVVEPLLYLPFDYYD